MVEPGDKMIRSAEEFRCIRLSDEEQAIVRASREDAPVAVWREVIERWPDMRFWVAHNRTIPLEILECLSRDQDERTRKRVAMKRKLPLDIRWRLAHDPAASVVQTIIQNRTTPLDLVEHIRNTTSDTWLRRLADARIGEASIDTP